MDLGLKGRRAVVTGGSKGIGYAVADELLAEGASVAICARDAAEVQDAVDRLGRDGRTVLGDAADVTDPGAIETFVEAAAKALGGIDILVNNAGGAHPGSFETLSDLAWQEDLDVKLFAQIRCTRACLAHLRKSSAARVINVNAVFARYPSPAFFATSVIRAACLSLTKVLAQQYGPEGVLVNSVNIGFVDTPQWESIHARLAPEVTLAAFYAGFAENEVPLKRFGDVKEVSGLVAFLAGDRASYITGAMIDVAGGMGKYV